MSCQPHPKLRHYREHAYGSGRRSEWIDRLAVFSSFVSLSVFAANLDEEKGSRLQITAVDTGISLKQATFREIDSLAAALRSCTHRVDEPGEPAGIIMSRPELGREVATSHPGSNLSHLAQSCGARTTGWRYWNSY